MSQCHSSPYHSDALWHDSPELSVIRQQALPDPTEDSLYIKSIVSLVSSGTETTVSTGQVPQTLHKTMRVPYMQGDFALPCTYGYSLVAEVIAGAQDWLGRCVHLLHPHQNAAVVASTDVFAVPENISAENAALVSNIETIINAIWDSQCQLGEAVVVAGFGSIGALLATTLQHVHFGPVFVIEPNPERAAIATKLGFTVITTGSPETCAVAFNTSASSSGLQQCINAVGFEGRVLELSWYGTRSTQIQLGHDFHSQRKQIICSQVSHIPTRKQNYWDIKRRKQLAFDLVSTGIYDRLPRQITPFQRAPELFAELRQGKHASILTFLRYD